MQTAKALAGLNICAGLSKLSLVAYIKGTKLSCAGPGPEVIVLEYSLKLKIKRNNWMFAHTCPQTANHCALF